MDEALKQALFQVRNSGSTDVGEVWKIAEVLADEVVEHQAQVSDAAEKALSLYYDNGDPALLEKLAKELVR